MIAADLHMHSCLSPCGDDEMQPADLVGMAKLNGLDLMALTDHNSAKNCPAAAAAAAEYDIGFIPGLEINTSEDIHCVCLFPDLERALQFDSVVHDSLPEIFNKPEIFGDQTIVYPDGTTGTEKKLLIAACGISITELHDLVKKYSGIFWPAHVDRDSNGLFAVLGTWPEDLEADAVEIRSKLPEGVPKNLKVIQSSDAHRFESMPDGGFPLPLESADFEGLKKYLTEK